MGLKRIERLTFYTDSYGRFVVKDRNGKRWDATEVAALTDNAIASMSASPSRWDIGPDERRIIRNMSHSDCVYLLEPVLDGYCKIGQTGYMQQRLRQLKKTVPFEFRLTHVIRVAPGLGLWDAERSLHERFAEKRIPHSEFFTLSPDDILFIKSIDTIGANTEL